MPIKIADKRCFYRLSQHSIFNALEYDEHKEEKLNLDSSDQLVISPLIYQDSGQSTCSDSTQYLSNSNSLETSIRDSLEVLDQENGVDILVETKSDPNRLEQDFILSPSTFVEIEHDSNLMSADYVHPNEEVPGSHNTQCAQVCPVNGDSVSLILQRNGGFEECKQTLNNSSWERGVQAHTHSSNNGYVIESKGHISQDVSAMEELTECDYNGSLCDEYQINDESITGTTDNRHVVKSTLRINSSNSLNQTTDSDIMYGDRNSLCGSDFPQEYEVRFTSSLHAKNSNNGYVTHPPVDTHSCDSFASGDFLSSVYTHSDNGDQAAEALCQSGNDCHRDPHSSDRDSSGYVTESTSSRYVSGSTGSGYVSGSTGSGYITESRSCGGYVMAGSTSSGYVTESTSSGVLNNMTSYLEDCDSLSISSESLSELVDDNSLNCKVHSSAEDNNNQLIVSTLDTSSSKLEAPSLFIVKSEDCPSKTFCPRQKPFHFLNSSTSPVGTQMDSSKGDSEPSVHFEFPSTVS